MGAPRASLAAATALVVFAVSGIRSGAGLAAANARAVEGGRRFDSADDEMQAARRAAQGRRLVTHEHLTQRAARLRKVVHSASVMLPGRVREAMTTERIRARMRKTRI